MCRFSEGAGWHRILKASGGMGLRWEEEQVFSCYMSKFYTHSQCLELRR